MSATIGEATRLSSWDPGRCGHPYRQADGIDGAATTSPDLRPGDAETFRQLWRGFGSTVALVATEHEARQHAMLATAVTSVSMDPPSLLVCINRSASARDALHRRAAFSLGILGSADRQLAAAIAEAPSGTRFAHGAWRRLRSADGSIDGLPWLEDAQATLFCEIDTHSRYGTHDIFVARVAGAIGTSDVDPLLYCDGAYGRFSRSGA